MMEIFLQRKLSWLDPVPNHMMERCNQLKLVSQEGQATSIPVQLLTASSPLLNSVLMPSFHCNSMTASISIPSATSSTLHLLAQILSMGETELSGGLETTMTSMNKLQSIFTLLGMNVKLCLKLSSSNLSNKTVHNGILAAVRDEVLTFGNAQFRGKEAQNHVGLLTKKKSTIRKQLLSGKFRQTPSLKKKENMIRNLCEDEMYLQDSCEEFDQNCDNVRFKQSGLLQDFKVNLVDCSPDGSLRDSISKNKTAKGKTSLIVCNICGVEVNKHVGLRRHYRDKHVIKDEKSVSTVIKLSLNKCPKCMKKFSSRKYLLKHFRRMHKNEVLPRKDTVKKVHLEVHQKKKESEECTKMEVVSSEILPKQNECNECNASFSHYQSLRRHIRKFHECKTMKPYGCGECDLNFIYKSSLRRHRRSVHDGRTYGCGVCDKITASRDGMRKHCNTSGHDKDLIYVVVDLP